VTRSQVTRPRPAFRPRPSRSRSDWRAANEGVSQAEVVSACSRATRSCSVCGPCSVCGRMHEHRTLVRRSNSQAPVKWPLGLIGDSTFRMTGWESVTVRGVSCEATIMHEWLKPGFMVRNVTVWFAMWSASLSRELKSDFALSLSRSNRAISYCQKCSECRPRVRRKSSRQLKVYGSSYVSQRLSGKQEE
jgi:hypothetical protein